jgi:hypothetical protein
MTDLPPKPSRWKLYLPFVASAVVAVGWSAFWKVAAGMTETGLDDWFVQERAQGREWSCPNRSVGGYPFRLEVRCAAPSFTGRIGAMVGAADRCEQTGCGERPHRRGPRGARLVESANSHAARLPLELSGR